MQARHDQSDYIYESNGDVYINIYVQPGGKKSEVLGLHNGAIKLRIQAPPVEGKANKMVCEFIANLLKLKKNQIELVSGEMSRIKRLKVTSESSDNIKKVFIKILESL